MTSWGDYRRRFGLMNRFTDHLYIRVVSTGNYSATAIYIIHKSPQHPLSLFQSAVSSPAVPWQRFLTVKILQLHALKSSLHRLLYRADSVVPNVFEITPRHRPRRNIPFPASSTSTVARQFVAARTCLPSCCLERSLVYLPVSRSSHSNGSTGHNTYEILFLYCIHLQNHTLNSTNVIPSRSSCVYHI
jgi:hypothetical protein